MSGRCAGAGSELSAAAGTVARSGAANQAEHRPAHRRQCPAPVTSPRAQHDTVKCARSSAGRVVVQVWCCASREGRNGVAALQRRYSGQAINGENSAEPHITSPSPQERHRMYNTGMSRKVCENHHNVYRENARQRLWQTSCPPTCRGQRRQATKWHAPQWRGVWPLACMRVRWRECRSAVAVSQALRCRVEGNRAAVK